MVFSPPRLLGGGGLLIRHGNPTPLDRRGGRSRGFGLPLPVKDRRQTLTRPVVGSRQLAHSRRF
jgi:hypothetical protein